MEMHFCYSTDDNYVKYMSVSLISAIVNNKQDELYFHILCQKVQESTKAQIKEFEKIYKNAHIKFYDINEADFTKYKDVPTYPGITLPAYFRLHLPEIITDAEKILYLDGDTVINGSLRSVFAVDLENCGLAGVVDIGSSSFEEIHAKYKFRKRTYVNSGIVLINLKYWREKHLVQQIDDFMLNHGDDIKFGDQDILNLVFVNQIKLLPDNVNVHGSNYFTRNTYRKPLIVHHVCKAWNYGQKTYYQSKYFKYLRLTPFRFKSRFKEYSWRFKTFFISAFKLLKKPKTLFSYEYLYGVYCWSFRRLYKK